ncbi:MAG: hypothetical protein AAF993_00680 [Pseudomonadota bacterium]
MSEAFEIRLDAPDSSLDELSFAEANPGAVADWVAALPLANTNETASQLKIATAELALLAAPGVTKFQGLEAVRPVVHYICSRLDRAQQTSNPATTANDLLLNLCTGYKAIVLDTLPSTSADKSGNKDVLPRAIHRLLSDLSRVLLRSLQAYVAPPQNFWWELNEVYRLAETLELTEFKFADDENTSVRSATVSAVYLRSLLLASCKSNQLQQHQIKAVFSALEHWSAHAMLQADTTDALLLIDLLANHGPQYAQFSKDPAEARALRTDVLAYEIEAYLKEISSSITIPETMPTPLLQHLVEAWSVMKPRTFKRMRSDSVLRVCVGLRAVHYFLSGGVDFAEQLNSAEALLRREVNPFLDLDYETSNTEADDPWSQAHDLKTRIPVNPNIETPEKILLEAAEPSKEKPNEHFETQVADTSPGGYRLDWQEQTPPRISVGELVALREEKDTRWCVAAVRWIQTHRGVLRMGVELLAPKAIPIALRIVQKKGGPTDFARGLLLPEIKAIKQPATIVTPKVPFASGQKVNVQRQGLHTTAQLLENQQNTESFNQFTFRMLDGYLEN